MIEHVRFYFKDDHGKKITNPNDQNGKGPSAHFYCGECNINYSNLDQFQVQQSAESHAILHVKFTYVPDSEFYRRMN